MSNTQTVTIDVLRSLAFGGISGSYAAVGDAIEEMVRLVCITNNTDGDMFFSTDGSNNMLFVAAGSFKLFDLNTNRFNRDQMWTLPGNTQFYVKQSSAPSKGAVYIECLFGQ
jgi:hypothetical protein